jgi:hypothetical protein
MRHWLIDEQTCCAWKIEHALMHFIINDTTVEIETH